MSTLLNQVHRRAERWVRTRFVFPLVVLLGGALLAVSENTYQNTTATLRGGIALTDARLQTTRLLQLLADAETAQFAYLVTGDEDDLARFAAAKAELPAVEARVTEFFSSLGPDGQAAARQVGDATRIAVSDFERALDLSRQNRQAAAFDAARSAHARAEALAVRELLRTQLERAAALQQVARTSIYDALQVNRAAVGALTLLALLLMGLFLRQLRLLDAQRAAQEAALLRDHGQLERQVHLRTARLAELARHLQTVREDERQRLARELHDELGGLLTASKLDLARARAKIGDPIEMLARLDRLNVNLNKGIELKRRIIEDLRPSALSNLGLTAALQILCDEMSGQLDIPVVLKAAELRLRPVAELAVYRCVQEALTNAGKYASAASIEVTVDVIDGRAVVRIEDDGDGFDPTISRVGHHGLEGMRFRAESLGGSMAVASEPGRGTTVSIEFPQTAASGAAVPTTTTETALVMVESQSIRA